MTCELAHLDGAYVLGALSPAERLSYERHLPSCASCARSVQELAGLPGLLGRVDVGLLQEPPLAVAVPETLLPSLVHEVRRTQRRHTLLTVGVSVGVTAAATLAAALLMLVPDGPVAPEASSSPTADAPPAQPMTRLVNGPVTADASVESVSWGTRIGIECSYAVGGYGDGLTTYALFVLTKDGRMEQVATWRGLPGKTMTISAATASDLADIVAVEVRTTGGVPVLELDT